MLLLLTVFTVYYEIYVWCLIWHFYLVLHLPKTQITQLSVKHLHGCFRYLGGVRGRRDPEPCGGNWKPAQAVPCYCINQLEQKILPVFLFMYSPASGTSCTWLQFQYMCRSQVQYWKDKMVDWALWTIIVSLWIFWHSICWGRLQTVWSGTLLAFITYVMTKGQVTGEDAAFTLGLLWVQLSALGWSTIIVWYCHDLLAGLDKWLKENSTNGMNSLFQCDCVSHFSRFPWESAFFSCSTSLFMERVLFLLDSEWLGSRRKVWCGCAPELPPCQSLCRAGFVWREGLKLSPKGHRALPFLVQRIAALNNSFLRNWTRVSCSGRVSVRLRTSSASWWAARGAWAQFCGLMATAARLGAGGGWWPQVPGVLGAVGTLTVRAEASLRASICAVWPPSGGATRDACNHICVWGGCWRSWVLPVWADILQHRECSPDERRCWRASAPRETASRSWKLEGKPCFVLAVRNRRNKSCILLTQQLQL